MLRRSFLTTTTALTANGMLFSRHSLAQTWPTRPIQLIVPFPVGSATDNVARILSRDMQDALGQALVIVNRPGAQTMIGSEIIARSPADGYAILVTANTFAAIPALFKGARE